MAGKNRKLDRDHIEQLHARAVGSVKPGAVTWAAEVTEMSRQTIHSWLAGKGQPTASQLARLQVVADVDERAREIHLDRMAGRRIWRSGFAWLGSSFDDLVKGAVLDRLEERAATQTRANAAFRPPKRESLLRTRSRY